MSTRIKLNPNDQIAENMKSVISASRPGMFVVDLFVYHFPPPTNMVDKIKAVVAQGPYFVHSPLPHVRTEFQFLTVN
jgi:hypothetical protein